MIKILHFITDTNIGGAGKLLCNQIKNIDTRRFKIFVALPKGSALIKELRSLPCSIIECHCASDNSLSLQSIFEDYEIIKKITPDIVHSHASLSSRIAATILFIPSRIFTKHCAFGSPKAIQNPIIKLVIGSANSLLSTKIIAVADVVKKELTDMGCKNESIKTVINGVEPLYVLSDDEKSYIRTKLGLRKNNFVVTMIARLEEYKGHATFLRAATICLKYYPDFRFLIVGDGSQNSTLKNLAHQLGIDKSVKFLGFCEDVAPILNITDLNVNCSYLSETSSLSLSEGMSLGIPCVASDCKGNTHMVKNGVNGLLFPCKNADALAQTLIRLHCDKELYSKCSAGAYKRFYDEFNANIMTERMMSIYRSEYIKHLKAPKIHAKI